MSWVWRESKVSIVSELLVLLAIADHADEYGCNAWPSIATIARKCRLSERRIQQIISSLVANGFLEVERQAGGTPDMRDDHRPNRYRVIMDGAKRVAPGTDNGVKSGNVRGETSGTDGVKPIAPKPLGIDTSSKEEVRGKEVLESSSKHSAPPEIVALANLFADLVEQNGSNRPRITDKWYVTFDRMIRIDHRTVVQIEAAIRWSQEHDFWSSNVMSPESLRRHYEKMRLQAKREQTKAQPRGMGGVREYLATIAKEDS